MCVCVCVFFCGRLVANLMFLFVRDFVSIVNCLRAHSANLTRLQQCLGREPMPSGSSLAIYVSRGFASRDDCSLVHRGGDIGER